MKIKIDGINNNRCIDCDIFESRVYEALAELSEQASEIDVTVDDLEDNDRRYTNAVIDYRAHRSLFHRVLELTNND